MLMENRMEGGEQILAKRFRGSIGQKKVSRNARAPRIECMPWLILYVRPCHLIVHYGV